MTHSIPSASSQPKIALTSLLKLKTSEETISVARESWLEQLNQIPEEKRGSYRTGIDRVIREMQDKSTLLKSEGWQSLQIIAELSKTIDLYTTSYALFDEHNATYAQQKVVEENKNLSLAEKFRRAGRSFQVYHLPEQTPTDPYKAQAQWEAVVTLGGVHAVGTGLQLAGETVTEGAKVLCKLTKTTETACRATLDFGKAVVEATGLPKAVQWVQKHGSEYLAEVIEERYEFPKEQAKLLAHQTVDDCLITATAGGTAIASNLVLKHLFKPNPVSGSVAAAAEQPANIAPRFTTSSHFVLDRGAYSLETQNYYALIPKIPEMPATASAAQTFPAAKPTQAATSGTQPPLTIEPGQNLFQLGRPTKTHTVFEDLKEHIQSCEWSSTMEAVIHNEERILNLLVPVLSTEVKKIVERIPFRNLEMTSRDYSTILIDQNNRFIRKEFNDFHVGVAEFIGIQSFKSLDLKQTLLAEPLAFWVQGEQTILIKNFLAGLPLQEWMGTVAKLPLNSRERLTSVMQLEKMAFSAGRSTGELQAKGSHLPPLPKSELESITELTIRDIGETLTEADCELSCIGKQFITEPEKLLVPIYEKFQSNPGPVSYGFGSNILPSDFLYNPGAPRPFACLNTQYIPSILDSKGIPRLFISEERARFHRLFLCDGFEAGLELTEIRGILQAYERGCRAEYQGPAPSPAAVQLHDLHASLEVIQSGSASLQAFGDPRMHSLIDSQIKYFDQKLHEYSLSKTTTPSEIVNP